MGTNLGILFNLHSVDEHVAYKLLFYNKIGRYKRHIWHKLLSSVTFTFEIKHGCTFLLVVTDIEQVAEFIRIRIAITYLVCHISLEKFASCKVVISIISLGFPGIVLLIFPSPEGLSALLKALNDVLLLRKFDFCLHFPRPPHLEK